MTTDDGVEYFNDPTVAEDQLVSRIKNEFYPRWWNTYTRTSKPKDGAASRLNAFEAGVIAGRRPLQSELAALRLRAETAEAIANEAVNALEPALKPLDWRCDSDGVWRGYIGERSYRAVKCGWGGWQYGLDLYPSKEAAIAAAEEGYREYILAAFLAARRLA